MINLLHESIGQAEIAQILQAIPMRPLLPPMGDRVWTRIAANPTVQKLMGPIRELAEKEIGEPLGPITDSLYGEFYAKGQRTNFENRYLERRRILARAAICALIDPADIRWLDSTLAKTEEILGEFSWALPAHVNMPSGKDPMHIDIFAAETANLMGELLTLFGGRMPTPLRQRIYQRLRTQFFENYVERHKDFWWTQATGHWNAVCHQGILGAALAVEPNIHLTARMLAIAREYLPAYINGFGPDGGCSDGVGYWQYGFGAFAILNRQMEVRTDAKLTLFENDDRIRKIARFGPRLMLENFHFVNFSDSPRKGALNPSMLIYLATRLDDEMLKAYAHRSYARIENSGINLNTQRADLLYLTRLFLNCPEKIEPDSPLPVEDAYFHHLGMAISRFHDGKGNLWEFAAKGGNNSEHQNHNDCGNFILNINGVPIVTEIGAPEYSKDYFSSMRYQFLAARTNGHSLPVVNGVEQQTGAQFAARVLSHESENDRLELSIDIAPCYPQIAGIGDLVRTIQVDKKAGRLAVRDDYEIVNPQSLEIGIMCDGEVIMEDGTAMIRDGGVSVRVMPFMDTYILTVEELEYRDHRGQPATINRIVLVPSRLESQKFVGYELEVV